MSDYLLPDPKNPKDWVRCLILSYKTLKGIDFDDRTWDKIHFSESIRAAQKILAVAGNLRVADECLVDVGKVLDEMNRHWNLHTIAKWSYEWIADKGIRRKDVTGSRTRFFDALAKRESKDETKENGKEAPARPMPDGVRGDPSF